MLGYPADARIARYPVDARIARYPTDARIAGYPVDVRIARYKSDPRISDSRILDFLNFHMPICICSNAYSTAVWESEFIPDIKTVELL